MPRTSPADGPVYELEAFWEILDHVLCGSILHLDVHVVEYQGVVGKEALRNLQATGNTRQN